MLLLRHCDKAELSVIAQGYRSIYIHKWKPSGFYEVMLCSFIIKLVQKSYNSVSNAAEKKDDAIGPAVIFVSIRISPPRERTVHK